MSVECNEIFTGINLWTAFQDLNSGPAQGWPLGFFIPRDLIGKTACRFA